MKFIGNFSPCPRHWAAEHPPTNESSQSQRPVQVVQLDSEMILDLWCGWGFFAPPSDPHRAISRGPRVKANHPHGISSATWERHIHCARKRPPGKAAKGTP